MEQIIITIIAAWIVILVFCWLIYILWIADPEEPTPEEKEYQGGWHEG